MAAVVVSCAAQKTTGAEPEPSATSPTANYKKRLLDLVDEFNAHPRVRVTHFYVAPPASKDDLAALDELTDSELDPAITSFYREMNGFQLRWLADGHRDFASVGETVTTKTRSFLVGEFADTNPTGQINIHALKDGLLSSQSVYKEHYWFDWMKEEKEPIEPAGKSYPLLTFAKSIRELDGWSHYYPVVFVLAHGDSNPAIVMGNDHGASWTDSCVTDFATYIEALIRLRGTAKSRRGLFAGSKNYDGHRRSPLTVADLPVAASLDSLIAEEKVVIYGDTSPTTQATSLRAAVIADDESGVSSSDVRLQIFHAAPGIEEGDVYSLNSVGGVDTNLVPDLGFGGFGSAPDLPKAPYDVGFEANSSGLIIADFTVPALTVEAASVFIIQDSADAVYLLAQLVGNSTALICENSATGPCEL